MRSNVVAGIAFVAAIATLPAQAASSSGYHPSRHVTYSGVLRHSGGWGTGPYWQGEPMDHRPIWRNGFYQGNDPDQRIRFDLMRDPTNERSQ